VKKGLEIETKKQHLVRIHGCRWDRVEQAGGRKGLEEQTPLEENNVGSVGDKDEE